jgi:uncharacterized membrane protein (DUF485 family)
VDTAPEHTSSGPPGDRDYTDVQHSAEFGELRRSYRSFVFPLTVGFTVWYLLYVLLSNYAGDFMGTKVVGHINVAFVFGLAQFLTTFLIAWWYSRFAAAKLDPRAEALKKRLDAENLQHSAGGGIGRQADRHDGDKSELTGQEDDA